MQSSSRPAERHAAREQERGDSSSDLLRRLARFAARVVDAPIAHVDVSIGDRRLVACIGLDSIDARREVLSFAKRIVRGTERVEQLANGLVAAGVPLRSSTGAIVGVLSLADAAPRAWTRDDGELLEELAAMIATEVELREARDTLERLASEAEERRLQLEAVVDASPVAILAVDPDGNVQTWNHAAERIFGWRADEVIGRPSPAVPADLVVECGVVRERALNAQGVAGMRTLRRRKDGTMINVSLSTAPLRGAHGEIVGVMAVLADISERVAAEEALRRSEEQRREAQKLEAIGRVAGGIAHDFNNIVGAIRGYGELLAAELDGAAGKDAREIVVAADRATALVRQLLAFSRSEKLEPAILDLNEIVLGLKPLLRKLIGDAVELELRLEAGLDRLSADASKLEQVLVNLAVNARDAMPDGGRVTITTGRAEHGKLVSLAVEDTGTGMDADAKARAFEPFFTTKGETGGTGLGLATVYGIVTQSGGRIELHSEPGAGTSFTIYLPTLEQDAPEQRPRLTRRQHEVLVLLAQGLTTKAIARRLVLAEATARNHINAVIAALGAHSRLEAVVKAQKLGLV